MSSTECVSGSTDYPLSKQLFVHGEKPAKDAFIPPIQEVEALKNGDFTDEEIWEEAGHRVRRMKPHGAGLWTSTQIEGAISDWVRFLRLDAANLVKGGEKVWKLTPRSDARIYTLSGVDDVREISVCLEEHHRTFENPLTGDDQEYVSRKYGIDFYALSQEYDAVWMPGEVEREVRLADVENPELSSWNAESTVWLNWVFEDVELVAEELPDVPTPDF